MYTIFMLMNSSGLLNTGTNIDNGTDTDRKFV